MTTIEQIDIAIAKLVMAQASTSRVEFLLKLRKRQIEKIESKKSETFGKGE